MDREIKFRAWVDTEDEGSQMFKWNRHVKRAFGTFVSRDGNGTARLMQYTGLQDKEGREIYEDDIAEETITTVKGEEIGDIKVIFEWGKHGFIKRVLDSRGGTGFIPDGAEADLAELTASEVASNCRIVGNKFEDPELLEEVD